MHSYDFVFSIGNIFMFNGAILKFSEDDIMEYYNNGLTNNDFKLNAYYYLSSENFLNFEHPRYTNSLPN